MDRQRVERRHHPRHDGRWLAWLPRGRPRALPPRGDPRRAARPGAQGRHRRTGEPCRPCTLWGPSGCPGTLNSSGAPPAARPCPLLCIAHRSPLLCYCCACASSTRGASSRVPMRRPTSSTSASRASCEWALPGGLWLAGASRASCELHSSAGLHDSASPPLVCRGVAGRDFCSVVHWRVDPDGALLVVAWSVEHAGESAVG